MRAVNPFSTSERSFLWRGLSIESIEPSGSRPMIVPCAELKSSGCFETWTTSAYFVSAQKRSCTPSFQ